MSKIKPQCLSIKIMGLIMEQGKVIKGEREEFVVENILFPGRREMFGDEIGLDIDYLCASSRKKCLLKLAGVYFFSRHRMGV